MTPEEHHKRHAELHRCLDELVADFIMHTNNLPSSTTIMSLMTWSHQQTVQPTALPAAEAPNQEKP